MLAFFTLKTATCNEGNGGINGHLLTRVIRGMAQGSCIGLLILCSALLFDRLYSVSSNPSHHDELVDLWETRWQSSSQLSNAQDRHNMNDLNRRSIHAEYSDPLINNAAWNQLNTEFAQRLSQLLSGLYADGYEFVLTEGYRSPERQAFLYAQGPHRTQAKPMESLHQLGLAADVAFKLNGAIAFDLKHPAVSDAYQQLGHRAESLGLIWGGRWAMADFGHVQWDRSKNKDNPLLVEP